MMKNRVHWILAAFVLLASSFSFAQTFTLSGSVVRAGADTKSLNGAILALSTTTGSLAATTVITNDQYSLSASPGTYVLVAYFEVSPGVPSANEFLSVDSPSLVVLSATTTQTVQIYLVDFETYEVLIPQTTSSFGSIAISDIVRLDGSPLPSSFPTASVQPSGASGILLFAGLQIKFHVTVEDGYKVGSVWKMPADSNLGDSEKLGLSADFSLSNVNQSSYYAPMDTTIPSIVLVYISESEMRTVSGCTLQDGRSVRTAFPIILGFLLLMFLIRVAMRRGRDERKA